ncbi:MAG: hypothetical protein IMF11_18970 [Proteobacteria bacterium]|nr:hypothetical protein [Pseudomonadota bacterium]
MISFLKNLIPDLLYGKRLGVDEHMIWRYGVIEAAFKAFVDDPSMSAVIVTGDNCDRIMRDIPCRLHYMQGNVKGSHLVIPAVAYQFFLSGGTWKEIEEYNAVKKYGMLHGKKRRL